MSSPTTTYRDVEVPGGISVHYAEAGNVSLPNLLLLHGFPSSSFQFRNLIPLLADKFHVTAPDLPGFGFTQVPKDFKYTFDNLQKTVSAFIDVVGLDKTGFAVYIFDYGAPTLFRLALNRPELIKAIISQNGNAYEDGLTNFWEPLQSWWATGDRDDPKWSAGVRQSIANYEGIEPQYTSGVPTDRLHLLDPHFPMLDYLLNVKDKLDIQLDLFFDYQNNVKFYPDFQRYLRSSQIPVLAVWGKGDPCFGPAGAKAYKKDVKDAEVILVDGGHFLLETHVKEVAHYVQQFLARIQY